MADQHDALFSELAQKPITEILGVVSASGSAGVGNGKNEWVLVFTLHFWKEVNGIVRNEKLTIRQPLNEEEFKSGFGQIRAYDIIHIQARVAEQNCFGSPQGLLVRFIRKDFFNADLKRCVSDLQKPVTFEDTKLGVFTLDRRTNSFQTQALWESTTIQLTLSIGEDEDPKGCLAVAYALWDLQSIWSKRVTDRAIAELLQLKNNNWLQDGEKVVSPEEFRIAMELESIVIEPDGTFDFWYDDGDLFYGHAIRVSGSFSEGLTFVGIEG